MIALSSEMCTLFWLIRKCGKMNLFGIKIIKINTDTQFTGLLKFLSSLKLSIHICKMMIIIIPIYRGVFRIK